MACSNVHCLHLFFDIKSFELIELIHKVFVSFGTGVGKELLSLRNIFLEVSQFILELGNVINVGLLVKVFDNGGGSLKILYNTHIKLGAFDHHFLLFEHDELAVELCCLLLLHFHLLHL